MKKPRRSCSSDGVERAEGLPVTTTHHLTSAGFREALRGALALKGQQLRPGQTQHCPVADHPDVTPSLTVRDQGADTPPLIVCRSRGCSIDEILAAVGLGGIESRTPPTLTGVRAEEPAVEYTTTVGGRDIRTKRRFDLLDPVTGDVIGRDTDIVWHTGDEDRSHYVWPHDEGVARVEELVRDGETPTIIIPRARATVSPYRTISMGSGCRSSRSPSPMEWVLTGRRSRRCARSKLRSQACRPTVGWNGRQP